MNAMRPICTSGATQQKTEILELVVIISPLARPIGILNPPWQNPDLFCTPFTVVKMCIIWFFSYTELDQEYGRLKLKSGSHDFIWKGNQNSEIQRQRFGRMAFNFQMRYQLLLAWPFIFSSFWCGRKCIHCGRGFA